MPSVLTGREVTALMRRHGVTIAQLARRMNLPQARVRYVREHGVQGLAFCWDWLEGITGDPAGAVNLPFHGTVRYRARGETGSFMVAVQALEAQDATAAVRARFARACPRLQQIEQILLVSGLPSLHAGSQHHAAPANAG